MSNPFQGQITIVGFNFAPKGYAFCDGQLLSINQNQALFALLGTTYGGDGRTTFGLPDLRGRTPIHFGEPNGTDFKLGQKSGAETVTLTKQQMPSHDHQLMGTTTPSTVNNPAGNVVGGAPDPIYEPFQRGQTTNMLAAAVSDEGADQAHDNKQPFLTINYCIALTGVFPSRN